MIRPLSSSRAPRYAAGTLVRHRRYDYRGVVVDADRHCQAPAQWYAANATQPDRDQPWYHVLVDGSSQSTYAAEENLGLELAPEAVRHPLVELYFASFDGTRYVRNDLPWGAHMGP